MGKVCWKCDKNIGLGKKSFKQKDLEKHPDNFGSDDYLCEDCFIEIFVMGELKTVKEVDDVFDKINDKFGKGKGFVKYQARIDELEVIKRNLERLEGFRCWVCDGVKIWPQFFTNNEGFEFVPLDKKAAVCNSCYSKIKKGSSIGAIYYSSRGKHKKSLEKREQEKLKILSKHGGTRLKLSLPEENNSKFDKEALDWLDWKQKVGESILCSDKNTALYYGGHKRYVSGGYYTNEAIGTLELSQNYLGFTEKNNKFNIIIPLSSIIVEDWNIETSARRKVTSGMIGFGFGNIHESGKKHTFVVPYIDENGIRQEPQFGFITFIGRNPAEKWAQVLYDKLVKVKKEKLETSVDKLSKNEENPLKVLKLRLAKGEISKEEFEELKQVLKLN